MGVLSFIAFVDSNRLLAHSLNSAYQTFILQLFVLPLILGATRRYERCYLMVLTYAVICYASSTISIWFPALATYATHEISQNQLHNIDATFGFLFLGICLNALGAVLDSSTLRDYSRLIPSLPTRTDACATQILDLADAYDSHNGNQR